VRPQVRSALVAAGVALTVTAGAAPAAAIHSGSPASTDFRPWAVAVLDDTGRQFCGGTLVTATKVVTAGHCVAERDITVMRFVAGRTDLRTTAGEVRRAARAWVHPRYDLMTYDIAVVTLARPMPYRALPLAGPEDRRLYAAGSAATVFGWGRVSEDATEGSPVLRRATLELAPPDACYPYTDADDPVWMKVCGLAPAGTTASICAGDSGGPLVAGGRLIGVVSTGNKYCRDEAPISVFTRTSSLELLRRQVYGG
jgi:trypsin